MPRVKRREKLRREISPRVVAMLAHGHDFLFLDGFLPDEIPVEDLRAAWAECREQAIEHYRSGGGTGACWAEHVFDKGRSEAAFYERQFNG